MSSLFCYGSFSTYTVITNLEGITFLGSLEDPLPTRRIEMAVNNVVFFIFMLLSVVAPMEVMTQQEKEFAEQARSMSKAEFEEERNETCPRQEIKGLIEEIHKLLRDLSAKAESCPGCCPTGWVRYGQSCYYIDDKPTHKWRKAVQNCWNLGGDLAKIKSAEENNFLFELVKKQNTMYGAWIGLIRSELASHFSWIGSLLQKDQYQNWRDGEPNHERTKETCVYMWGPKYQQPGTWEDVPCNLKKSIEDGEKPPVALCQRSL